MHYPNSNIPYNIDTPDMSEKYNNKSIKAFLLADVIFLSNKITKIKK